MAQLIDIRRVAVAPKHFTARVTIANGGPLMTDEDLDGFTLDQLKCRACSGYGNCGYKQMNIYNGKAVSICQMRKKKLQCERDGVPFEM